MLDYLNKINGLIGVGGLFLSFIVYFFTEYKWIGGILFLLIALLCIYLWFKNKQKPPMHFDEVRQKAKILFVDDKKCPIATNLQRNRFDVREVSDIIIVDDQNVQWANLIFVDYKGVGIRLTGKKEGLGLINELQRTYGTNKRYVIYSSEQDFDGIVKFPYIRKNASYDEFISLISVEISKL